MPGMKGAGYLYTSIRRKKHPEQKTQIQPSILEATSTTDLEFPSSEVSWNKLRQKDRGCRHCRRSHNVRSNPVDCQMNMIVKCIGCEKILASKVPNAAQISNRITLLSCCAELYGKLSKGAGGRLLKAVRRGDIDRVIDLLDNQNVDIRTSNHTGVTSLLLAASQDNYNLVQTLLKRGAPINQATKNGNTPLHVACYLGRYRIAKLLVKRGANINRVTEESFTPLYMAAQEGHEEIVRYLLENGADASLSTKEGFTPLAVAVQMQQKEVVNTLLEYEPGSKPQIRPMHIAAKDDDANMATLLLRKNPRKEKMAEVLVNEAIEETGYTPLHVAAHYGNVNVAEVFHERGALLNIKAVNGITPLHVAAKQGHLNFCSFLLEHNAKPDLQTRDGLLPLHCAARAGHFEIVQLFLSVLNISKFGKTKSDLTALHMAVQGGHLEVVQLLLDNGFEIDAITSSGLHPIHIAVHYGHLDVVDLLLEKGVDVNIVSMNGFTPLHVACKMGHSDVVRVLIENGADIEAEIESSLRPLQISSYQGHFSIVQLLIEKKADIQARNKNGETALDIARRSNRIEIVNFLKRLTEKFEAVKTGRSLMFDSDKKLVGCKKQKFNPANCASDVENRTDNLPSTSSEGEFHLKDTNIPNSDTSLSSLIRRVLKTEDKEERQLDANF